MSCRRRKVKSSSISILSISLIFLSLHWFWRCNKCFVVLPLIHFKTRLFQFTLSIFFWAPSIIFFIVCIVVGFIRCRAKSSKHMAKSFKLMHWVYQVVEMLNEFHSEITTTTTKTFIRFIKILCQSKRPKLTLTEINNRNCSNE